MGLRGLMRLIGFVVHGSQFTVHCLGLRLTVLLFAVYRKQLRTVNRERRTVNFNSLVRLSFELMHGFRWL